MIVEQDRVTHQKETLTQERKFLEQVIRSAEIYERLSSNSDFKQYVKDVEDRIKAHDTNINGYVASLASVSSPFKRMRLMETIANHQIRKEECQTLISFPETTKRSKEEALTRLEEIDHTLKEINHA